MNDKQKIAELEAVLAQFLRPIKNIPFSLIIKSMSGHVVIPVEPASPLGKALVERLINVAKLVAAV